MNIFKDFNYGLGVLPTSVFVDSNFSISSELDEIYSKITSHNTHDVIFYNTYNGLFYLDWVIPKLISEGYFVSLVYKYNRIEQLPCNRVICFLDIVEFDRNESTLSNYTENDLLILDSSSQLKFVEKLNRCLSILKKDNFKGKVMLNKTMWVSKELLESNIDYIYKYEGNIL